MNDAGHVLCQVEMHGSSQESLKDRLQRAVAWIALSAYTAFLVFTPIHLISEAHCHHPGLMPRETAHHAACEEASRNHQGHHHHGDEDTPFHSAEDHSLLAALKDGSNMLWHDAPQQPLTLTAPDQAATWLPAGLVPRFPSVTCFRHLPSRAPPRA